MGLGIFYQQCVECQPRRIDKPMVGYSTSSNRSSYGLPCGFWSNSQVPSQSFLVVWTLSDLNFYVLVSFSFITVFLRSYYMLHCHPFARVLDVFTTLYRLQSSFSQEL